MSLDVAHIGSMFLPMGNRGFKFCFQGIRSETLTVPNYIRDFLYAMSEKYFVYQKLKTRDQHSFCS